MVKHSISFSEQLVGWWCVVHDHKLYFQPPKNTLPFGTFSELNLPIESPELVHQIGDYEGDPIYLVANVVPTEVDEFAGLKTCLANQPDMFEFAARAFQVDLFLKTHKFCGQCGSKMDIVDWELATHCPSCGHRCYPRISPVVIVAIRNGEKILLAQGKRSTSGFFSVLAGFVESGETLEQAAHREVFEEVGVKIKNLKYFGSQPWPFPHSLMVGYTAEYDSGDIKICEKEILAADWFDLDSMPTVPSTLSIAGQLIEKTKVMMKLAKR